ncbi:hypothetical protein GIB67_026619 [Kingdonia uniflora]|uniref:Uncharacterized protein n=1 Tax=Kingdonia uniflora TaxID=39325 RepID=A0A7J7NIK5_9MAGN|nr:hypothetical protein GIB67_026619 [Kingdonia uniflora]
MALRFSLILALIALAWVVESSLNVNEVQSHLGLAHFGNEDNSVLSKICESNPSECLNHSIDGGIIRRGLARRNGRRYISYGALKKNQVPCNRRGSSYYGCGRASKVNPYRRGCSKITHCYRNTK